MNGHPGTLPLPFARNVNRHTGRRKGESVPKKSVENVRLLIKEGKLSGGEIAQRAGVSQAFVSQTRKAMGFPLLKRGRKKYSGNFIIVAPLLKKGLSIHAIQLKTGLSDSAIFHHRMLLGMPKLKPGPVLNVKIQNRVRAMKIKGMTYAAIGRKLGFTRQRAQQYLSERKHQQKPKCCQCCKRAAKKLEGHHPDYRERKVVWLCTSCHYALEYVPKNRLEKYLHF